MTQIAMGPQCRCCQLVRIGREDLGEPFAWLCAPFPDGIPRPYDTGKQDCPYRQPMAEDHYRPSGIKGRIKSKVLRADWDRSGMRGTLLRIADPGSGVSREEYEAICKALGITPKPPKSSTPGK